MNQPNQLDGIEKQLNIGVQSKAVADYQREIRAKYLMVFKEGIAVEVLGDILALCGFPGSAGDIHYGLDPNDKAMIGRFNVGIEIAEKAGVLKAIAGHIFGLTIKSGAL